MTTFYGYNWYETNSQRRYPLADIATGIDDAGHSLPDDIIVDANICFPRNYGDVAFLGAVQVTANVRTAVIMVHKIADDSVVPVASISISANDAYAHRQHAIQPMLPGVAGWIVFGNCVIEGGTHRALFSTPDQSQLALGVARSYAVPPVSGLGKLYAGANNMHGIVELRAGTNMLVQHAIRAVALTEGEDATDTEVISFAIDAKMNPELFSELAGPVGHRPESRTCNRPVIEQLNQVTPDCDGNINLVFTSDCVVQTDVDGGTIVDYCLGLEDACTRDWRLPVDGKLPNEYDDLCLVPEGLEPSSPAPPGPEPSSPAPPTSTLPLTTAFAYWPSDLMVAQGSFTVTGGVASSSTGLRCVAVWNDAGYWPIFDKMCETAAAINVGGLESFGVIVGWDPTRDTSPYLLVELDKSSSSFRIRYFSGHGYFSITAVAPVPIVYGTVYKIRVSVTGSDPTVMTCQLYRGATLVATIDYPTQLIAAESLFGIHANQSVIDFHSFTIDNV